MNLEVFNVSLGNVKILSFVSRSNRLEVFCKKDVLKNFAKFTGKQLFQSLFFNKVAGLRTAMLIKKRLWHTRFAVNFAKFLRTPFLTNHLRSLLLYLISISRIFIRILRDVFICGLHLVFKL